MFEKCVKCELLGKKCAPYLMSMDAQRLVRWCKKRKAHLGMTNAQLAEQSGVPLSTINRFYAQEYTDFRYSTVQQIVGVLTGCSVEQLPCPVRDDAEAVIKDLQERAQDVRVVHESYQSEISAVRVDLQRRIDYLTGRLADQSAILAAKERRITFLVIALLTLCSIVIGILIYDYTHPQIGFIRV